MFYITASVYAFGTTFYGLFGSGRLQPWAMTSKSVQDLDVEVNVNPVDGEEKKSAT